MKITALRLVLEMISLSFIARNKRTHFLNICGDDKYPFFFIPEKLTQIV